jgi:general secretion pathway protein G
MFSLPQLIPSPRKGFTLIGLPFFSEEKKRSYKGFTLIELMVAISVVAVLSTIGLMVYTNSQKLARDTRRKDDLRQIKNALVLYYNDVKQYPTATDMLTSNGGGTWIPVLTTNYIDRLPRDPLNTCTGTIGASVNCYQYGYQTISAAAPCPAANQHFILVATLENSADPTANSKMAYTLCNGATFSNPNLYLLSNN